MHRRKGAEASLRRRAPSQEFRGGPYLEAFRKARPSFVASDALRPILLESILADASIGQAARADLSAVLRARSGFQPASGTFPFLQRLRRDPNPSHRALALEWRKTKRRSLSAEPVIRDFPDRHHPGAQLGKGVFLDHATGFVAGETVVIEDNVSILHGVTLGGTGTEKPIVTQRSEPAS